MSDSNDIWGDFPLSAGADDATDRLTSGKVGHTSGDAKSKNKPRSATNKNSYHFAEIEAVAEGASFLAALGVGLIPLSTLSEIAVVESGDANLYPGGDGRMGYDFRVKDMAAQADRYLVEKITVPSDENGNLEMRAGILVFDADGRVYAFNFEDASAVLGDEWRNNDQSLEFEEHVLAAQLESWLVHWGDFSIPILSLLPSEEGGHALGAVFRSYLIGSDADDELIGDDTPNILDGGGGNDRLTGGGGGDTFIYRFDSGGQPSLIGWRGVDGQDEIIDFSLAEGDKLVLVDVAVTGDRIDTIEEFRQAFNSETSVMIDTTDPDGNIIEIAFGEGEGGVRISLTEPVNPGLFSDSDDEFDNFDEFIDVLSNDTSLFG